jgi:hypothetical protein
MPLDKWGEGIDTVLRGLAADNPALNRRAGLGSRTEADVLAAAAGESPNRALEPQSEEGRPNARTLSVDDIATRIPYLDDAGRNFVRQVMAAYGYPPGSRISGMEAKALQQAALRDPRVVSGFLKQLRRGLAAGIVNAEQELRELYRAEPRTGLEGASLKAAVRQKEAEIQDLKTKLAEMNFTGPRQREKKRGETGAGEPENAGSAQMATAAALRERAAAIDDPELKERLLAAAAAIEQEGIGIGGDALQPGAGTDAPPAGTVTINGRQYTKILMDPDTGDEFGVLADGTRELVKQCVIPRAAAAPSARTAGPTVRGSHRRPEFLRGRRRGPVGFERQPAAGAGRGGFPRRP